MFLQGLLSIFFLSGTLLALGFELPQEETYLKVIRPTVIFPELSADEQQTTRQLYELVYDQIYAHTEMKKEYFQDPSLDPVLRVRQVSTGNTIDFLNQISSITLDLRDLHQSTRWPQPYGCLRTFIPLEFGFASHVNFDKKIVIHNGNFEKIKNLAIASELKALAEKIKPGDVVEAIDGEDPWAVLSQSEKFGAGANPDAYLSEGLYALGYYSQREREFPKNDLMTLRLRNETEVYEVEVPFLVKTSAACVAGDDRPQQLSSRPRPFITRTHPQADDFRSDSSRLKTKLQSRLIEYEKSEEPTIGSAMLSHQGINYGYLRIEEFSPELDLDKIFPIIEKILHHFEANTKGLILDVRGNPGGIYGDYLTQYFSKVKVIPQTEEIRASILNYKMLQNMDDKTEDAWLKAYLTSVKKALSKGERYTERLQFNTANYLNEKGRIYKHPVIIITDPNCYSYCDYFTTSMQDHHAAEVWIENGRHTGGGGASVSSYEAFSKVVPTEMPPLPQKQNIGIAFSSGYRTGPKADVPIENLGADADRVYNTTFNDVKNGDTDLMNELFIRLEEMSKSGK